MAAITAVLTGSLHAQESVTDLKGGASSGAQPAPAIQGTPEPKGGAWPDLNLKVGGLLHLWAIPWDQNDPAQNDPIVLGDPNLDEGFSVRRARVNVRGSLTKSISFGFQLGYESEFTGTKDAPEFPELEEAYLDFHRGRLPHIQLGVNKVPFGQQNYSSSGSLLLIDRAVTSEVLTYGRDIGLLFYGDLGRDEGTGFGLRGVHYWLGFYNGSGSIFRDDNGIGDVEGATDTATNPFGLAQVLRADVELGTKAAPGESNLGRSWSDVTLRLGANAVSNRMLESRAVGYGGDFGMFVGPLSLQLEMLWRTTFPQFTNEGTPDVLADVPAFGWYVQGGFHVIPNRLQLAARFESFDGNSHFTDADDLSIITAGLNFYPYRTDALKAQLNYVRRIESSPDLQVNNDSIYLNLGAFF
jgi:hypothetical protein